MAGKLRAVATGNTRPGQFTGGYDCRTKSRRGEGEVCTRRVRKTDRASGGEHAAAEAMNEKIADRVSEARLCCVASDCC